MFDKQVNLDHHMLACAAKMSVTKKGDGNSAQYIIKVGGDQFYETLFKKVDDGFELQITGEWEFQDFATALNEAYGAL